VALALWRSFGTGAVINVAARLFLYYTSVRMLRVHPSALNHGCSIEDISHAIDMAMYEGMLDEDNDPPKLLILGPDPAANILELVGGELAGDVLLIWHAKPCSAEYFGLLPAEGVA
jgi:hypothetical protein